MDLHLDGKVFVVTGGSQGIGEAITRCLLEEGAIPVVAALSAEANRRLVEASGDHRHDILVMDGDLSDTRFSKAVITEAAERYGRIDGVVNNAGVNDNVGLDQGPEAFRKSLDRNLHFYYDLVHFALPWLKASHGAIVNISSKVALTGQGRTSGYAAAKGGILALTREWAVDLLADGIRVNAVLPAEVMTPLYRQWLTQFDDPVAKEQAICQKIPLGKRMTTPDEIAAAVVFLLSDRSSHTTGQFISVDGGYLHLDRALS